MIRRLFHYWTLGCRLLLLRLYSSLAIWRFRASGARVGARFRAYGWVDLEIHPLATVVLGNHFRINSGFALNPVGGYRRSGICVGKKAILTVGDNVGISNSTLVCMDSITIGDNVFIGGDCKIYDTDFHPLEAEARIKHHNDSTQTAKIAIGKNSFIGAHTLILKGVNIGAEAIIGAGSVVTTDVPDGEVWAGVPARRIRS